MEMGQPPVQNADPAMWAQARQYTGRIVSVSNARVFDEPVFNYTRKFPYIWEEMSIPISYRDDRAAAERILLQAAEKHTVKIAEIGQQAIQELERRYVMKRMEMKPKVYMRMTNNWVELAVRFIAKDHRVRELKDAMTREILGALDNAQMNIASTSFEIVGLPTLRIERTAAQHRQHVYHDNGDNAMKD